MQIFQKHHACDEGDVHDDLDNLRYTWYCNEILRRTVDSGPISSIEFNKEGTHLAYGNSDGVVSVVEIGQAEESEFTHARHVCSKPYQSFLSHEPEFDCLKSQAIEEKISFIRWLPRIGPSHFLLSSNERTIKLWKLSEVPDLQFANLNFPTETGCRKKFVIRTSSDIKIPKCQSSAVTSRVRLYNKQTYSRGHCFSIADIAPCADQEHFLSADPLRIHLWNLEVHNETFNIVDHMPERLEDVTHLITSLACANHSPSLFAYCTNRGSIRFCDTRTNSLCDKAMLTFDSLSPDEPNLLTLFITSISSISFGHTSDRFIFTRDYLNAKVWDTHMPCGPCEVYPIEPQLRSHLSHLYETEMIFDDFSLAVSPNDRYIATGSYRNAVKVMDRHTGPSGTYHLKMQNECSTGSLTDQLSVFSGDDDVPDFDSSWPRQLAVDNTKLPPSNELLADTMSSDVALYHMGSPLYTQASRKWTHMTWSPKAPVIAAGYADGIHLLQALV